MGGGGGWGVFLPPSAPHLHLQLTLWSTLGRPPAQMGRRLPQKQIWHPKQVYVSPALRFARLN